MTEETKLNEAELEHVQGGADVYQYAHGSFSDYESFLVYTVAGGDALSGIALRFGVTVSQLQQWNGIKNPNLINIGQKLTVYPTIRR